MIRELFFRDKENFKVVMTTKDYRKNILETVEKGSVHVVCNPKRRIDEAITSLVKLAHNFDDRGKRTLVTTNPTPPLLYSLPKIHTEQIPLRPIVT